MKHLFTFLSAVLLTASVFAQSPEKMSYQAVIRDTSDNLVTSQTVGMQISILQGSASGTVVYTETQTPTTNANGLVSIEIGAGTSSHDFSAIDWSTGTYFIKTETDITGGTSYTITGTRQLLSVPYALHAKTAESVTGGLEQQVDDLKTLVYNNSTPSELLNAGISVTEMINRGVIADEEELIGIYHEGGVIFYIDSTTSTGLVCAVSDASSKLRWSSEFDTTNATGEAIGTGQSNTDSILNYYSSDQTKAPAAYYCNILTMNGYDDWFLPSIDELEAMHIHKDAINTTANSNGGGSFTDGGYWSSTEIDSNSAYKLDVNGGTSHKGGKGFGYVRAVRAF